MAYSSVTKGPYRAACAVSERTAVNPKHLLAAVTVPTPTVPHINPYVVAACLIAAAVGIALWKTTVGKILIIGGVFFLLFGSGVIHH